MEIEKTETNSVLLLVYQQNLKCCDLYHFLPKFGYVNNKPVFSGGKDDWFKAPREPLPDPDNHCWGSLAKITKTEITKLYDYHHKIHLTYLRKKLYRIGIIENMATENCRTQAQLQAYCDPGE